MYWMPGFSWRTPMCGCLSCRLLRARWNVSWNSGRTAGQKRENAPVIYCCGKIHLRLQRFFFTLTLLFYIKQWTTAYKWRVIFPVVKRWRRNGLHLCYFKGYYNREAFVFIWIRKGNSYDIGNPAVFVKKMNFAGKFPVIRILLNLCALTLMDRWRKILLL